CLSPLPRAGGEGGVRGSQALVLKTLGAGREATAQRRRPRPLSAGPVLPEAAGRRVPTGERTAAPGVYKPRPLHEKPTAAESAAARPSPPQRMRVFCQRPPLPLERAGVRGILP